MKLSRRNIVAIIRRADQILGLFWNTKICYVIGWLKEIHLGKGIRFYGKSYFLKSKNAHFQIGDNCTFRSSPLSNLIGVNRPCIISAFEDSRVIIGNNCGFSGTVIGGFKEVVLGENVRCGANTLITDSDWHLDDFRTSEPQAVFIGDNVWLGVNVIVMKGVIIGENSVIGAGSVVTRSIPPNVIAAGNPCVVIKCIDD